MGTPPRQHIETFAPLKYGFKALIELWPIAFVYTGLYLLSLLPALPLLMPIMPTAIGLLVILFRTILYVGLIETALLWYDTGTASWKTLVSKSYKTVFRVICVSTGLMLSLVAAILLTLLLTSLTSSFSDSTLVISLVLLACAPIYAILRYWFVFYYMIDTKCVFKYALQQTDKVLWRINFVRILLTLLIPLIIAFPIGDWVYTFAMVYVYRQLFPKNTGDFSLSKDIETHRVT